MPYKFLILALTFLGIVACGDDPDLDALCTFPAVELERPFTATTTCNGGASATIRPVDFEIDSTGALGDTEEFVSATVEVTNGDVFFSEASFSACNRNRPGQDRGTFTFTLGSGATAIICRNVFVDTQGSDIDCTIESTGDDAGCSIRIDAVN